MEVLCRALCAHHACELAQLRPDVLEWADAVTRDFRPRTIPSALHRWTRGMSSSLLFSGTVAVLLAYDRTQQHSTGAISIFLGGLAAVFTPRVLQIGYTVQSNVAEHVRPLKVPPRPAFSGKPVEDSHLRMVIAMLQLRTSSEFVPPQLLLQDPGPMLQNRTADPSDEETDAEYDDPGGCVTANPVSLEDVGAADPADREASLLGGEGTT